MAAADDGSFFLIQTEIDSGPGCRSHDLKFRIAMKAVLGAAKEAFQNAQ